MSRERDGEGRTVGAVARLAGVTARALHHYDELGMALGEIAAVDS